MLRICFILFCLCTPSICAAAAEHGTAAQIVQLRARIRANREAFFANESGKPLVRGQILKNWRNRGDFTRHYVQSILLFSMRACELNEQLDEANAVLREMSQYHLDRPQTFFEIHSFPGAVSALARLYVFFGPHGTKAANRLSAKTCAVLEKTFWEWANEKSRIEDAEWERSQTWWLANSENHHAAHVTSCWSSARVLRDVPGYRDKPFQDGHTPAEHYEAWTDYLKEYLRQRACKGTFVEIDSPSYATTVVACMCNFYDFSDDPVLKKRARQLLELHWALWAEEQIDGVTGGAQTRCYAKHAVRGGAFLRNAASYVIGIGEPGSYHSSMVPFVTTTWEVPDIVLKIVASRAAHDPYEIRQRRMGLAEEGHNRPPRYRLRTDFGGILRYAYCTPDFIMGSLITEARPTSDWAAISSQNRWSGVIFAGDPDARVFASPHDPKGNSVLNGFWCLQSRGTMISQRLPSGSEGPPDGGGNASVGWRVFLSAAGLSKPVQQGPWTFAEARDAYVGIRVVEGGASFEQSRWGHWLVCKDTLTPVILEAGRRSDHSTFAAFQAAATARPMSFHDRVLKYQSLGGEALTFYADRSRLPKINGAVVDLAPDRVYDSPFVQSKWDSGVVTVRCGEERRILNFNE